MCAILTRCQCIILLVRAVFIYNYEQHLLVAEKNRKIIIHDNKHTTVNWWKQNINLANQKNNYVWNYFFERK